MYNSNAAAVARASRQKTKDSLKVEHQKALQEKARILDSAARLFFEITSKSTVQQHVSPSTQTTQLSLDMDTVQKMCTAAASVALQQHRQEQQQQREQQLAIADGEITTKLDKIEKGIASTDAVKRLAVDALLDDPKTYEEIEDRAVETLLQRKNEDLILKAAERIKRARRIEEEEEEEESDEDEESSEDEE